MKKLFITLLCVIMVAVFMPTMAFAAAPDFTKDVTLTENASVAETVTVDKNITVDLGGKELLFTGESGKYLFDVVGGAKLTIKNGTIKTTNGRGVNITDGSVTFEGVKYEGPERALGIYGGSATVDANSEFTVFGGDAGIFVRTLDASKPSTLDLYGSVMQTAEKGSFGVVGNGTDETGKTVINIHEEAFVSSLSAAGIYHPHNGKMTVAGVVEGITGIEIRAGELTVEPTAYISANGETYKSEPNGNGATSTGAAIAANQHTTKQPINVVINGGVLYGAASVVADGVQNDVSENVTVTVSDGIFEGTVKEVKDGGDIVIEGGAFTEIDRETVNVTAVDSAIVKEGEMVLEVLGIDPINNYLKDLSENAPAEYIETVTVEITNASADSKFVVPVGLTVKNATGDKITVNDAELGVDEEITVEEPKEDPQEPVDPVEPGTDEPGTDEPGTDEPGTDEPGAGEPDADKPDDKEPAKEPAGNVSETGDEMTFLPWIALMILTVGAAAALKKKENQ